MTIPNRISCSLLIALLYAHSSASGFVVHIPRAVAAGVSSSASRLLSSPPINNDVDRDVNVNVNDIKSTTKPPPSSSPSALNRRSALERCGGMALSSLLLSSSSSSSPDPAYAYVDFDDARKKKRILITGSNSGIGLDAAQRMVLRGHEVVLACVSDFDDGRVRRRFLALGER